MDLVLAVHAEVPVMKVKRLKVRSDGCKRRSKKGRVVAGI